MPTPKIAILTAGGLAPCLSSAVGGLIEHYSRSEPGAEIIGYRSGYMGLLKGDSLAVSQTVREQAHVLHRYGGSPLGNSRVKLTNVADCLKRGLVQPGQDPLRVAAEQLARDNITILHTVGGDDTNITAADLSAYLAANGYALTVVGLPKTVDNDIVPIRQSLGAATAAEQGAIFFRNVVNEGTASPRTLIVHEVMGRHCGWLTAATAQAYRALLDGAEFLPDFGLARAGKDIDAVYVPELAIDLQAEAERLRERMDRNGSVNVFLSEGAGVDEIVAAIESRGGTVERDAFDHVMLDKINVGDWFSKQFAKAIGAEKTLVQKSGYFARSAAANDEDLRLIENMVALAAQCGLDGESGVIGHDEERGNALRAIELSRIRGAKRFDIRSGWFRSMLSDIGQAAGSQAEAGQGGGA